MVNNTTQNKIDKLVKEVREWNRKFDLGVTLHAEGKYLQRMTKEEVQDLIKMETLQFVLPLLAEIKLLRGDFD